MTTGDTHVPRVAVVIPAHGSVSDLRRALASTAVQDWPRERLQLVVAVDGPDLALEHAAAAQADTVVVLPHNAGSYSARNAALDALDANVSVVCFTDSDCVVSTGWVRAHVDALASVALSGGAVEVTMRSRPSPAEFVDKCRHLKQFSYVTTEGFAATANLAVRREVVDAVRFDGALRSGGDAEFCGRAIERGFTLAYTERASVCHPARTTAAEVRRKVRRIAAGIRANPQRWVAREITPRPFDLTVPKWAFRDAVSRDPVWLLRAWLLELWSARTIRLAAVDARRSGTVNA